MLRLRRCRSPRLGHRGQTSVRCETCGWQQRWSRFSKRWKGEGLVTGAGLPACEDFVRQWPHAGNASQCMILIDGFVHALHDGPLAPLLVEGDRESVLALLDKIASQ